MKIQTAARLLLFSAGLLAVILLLGCGAAERVLPAPQRHIGPPAPVATPTAAPPRETAQVIEHAGSGPLLSGVEAGENITINVYQGAQPRTPQLPPESRAPKAPQTPEAGRPAPIDPISQLTTHGELRGSLTAHEGLSQQPYTLRGELHECYGSLGSDGTWKSSEQCEQELQRDMETALADARVFVGGVTWALLSPRRRAVVAELAFMTGRTNLQKFKRFRQALRALNYQAAANELQDSPKLIQDVGQARVDDLKERLIHGENN